MNSRRGLPFVLLFKLTWCSKSTPYKFNRCDRTISCALAPGKSPGSGKCKAYSDVLSDRSITGHLKSPDRHMSCKRVQIRRGKRTGIDEATLYRASCFAA